MINSLQHNRSLISLNSVPIGKYLLFLIWPFSGLIYAINNFRKNDAPTLFWLFCMYFGFVFIFADPVWGGKDSASYAANLIDMHYHVLSFDYLLSRLYNPRAGEVDIFEPMITWFVAIFTDDPRYLFLAVAAVFGFFYTQNLWMIFRLINKKPDYLMILFMLAYALVISIWQINGVRMWTAAQIFIFGLIKYFIYHDKRGLIWSASAILVHFSFMFPVAILFIWIFLPSRYGLFFSFYVISFFLNEINLGAIRSTLDFMPDVFQSRIKGYTNEEYVFSRDIAAKELAWHVLFVGLIEKWLVFGIVVLVYLFRNRFKRQFKPYKRIFLFTLFFGGFANIVASVPTAGRFTMITNMMFFGIFILTFELPLLKKITQRFSIFIWPFVAFYVVFQIRVGLDYIGVLTFFGNPVLAYFIDDQTPFIDFVKNLVS